MRASARFGPLRQRVADAGGVTAPVVNGRRVADLGVEVGRRRAIVSDLPSPIIELTRDGRLRFANHAAGELLGLSAVQRGCQLLDVIGATAGDHERLRRRLAPLLARRTAVVRVWLDPLDSAIKPIVWRVARRRDSCDRTLGFVAQTDSRTPLDRSATRVALLERRLTNLAAATPDWLWETDAQHRFTYLSRRLEVLTGIAPSRLLGQTRTALMTATLPPDAVARHAAELAAHRPFHDLSYELRVDGKERQIRVSGRPVFGDDGRFRGYCGVGWEAGRAGAAVTRPGIATRHDPLTGLVNRQVLGEKLAAATLGLERSGKQVVLLVLDLEAFKRVNESYGHRIGDLLLQHAASRLERCVAGADTTARLGGDEFAVVATQSPGGLSSGVAIAERIVARLRQPFGILGQEIHCGVRVGVAVAPEHGSDVEALLQHAELALTEAKRQNEPVFLYGRELGTALKRRKSIEDALRRALGRDELSLVLQPQLALRDRRLVAGEALLRWRHGRPDEVGPGVFVPIAEDSGLIVELGSWVLAEACRLVAHWRCRDPSLRVAVNLSPVQFCDRDLACEVEQALAVAGLPPEALELEITEGALMRDAQSAARTLNELHELGVGIALDDFGTGYSSLSYLKRFPIQRLKIDQAFVRDLEHDANDRQITKAIVGLGHSLGLEVVAEGVETEGQLAFLDGLGCDIAQGYLFSRPLAVAAFEAALRTSDRFAPLEAGQLLASGRKKGIAPAQLHA